MDAILVVLDRCGGRSTAGEVQEAVRRLLDRYLTEIDLGPVPSNAGELRWRNDTRWARDQLVGEGLLEPVHIAGWGRWCLTEAGRAAVQDAASRLGAPGSSRGYGARSDSREPRVPAGGARQLQFLAEVYRRAHETPVGSVDHPALADVVALLERLLKAQLDPPLLPVPAPRSSSSHSVGQSAPRWSAPVKTSTRLPNHMDAERMRAFIDGPWLDAVKKLHALPIAERVARATDLDLLAALPLVTCLVAARSDWLPLPEGVALAARAAHRVLTEGARPGGLLGGLRAGGGGVAADTIRNGLFHRALTAWVQHLDASADDTVALRAAPLRGWLSGFRVDVGDPEGEGPRLADPLWAWLFTVDPSFEAPREGGVEEAAAALAMWLPTAPRGPHRGPPERGVLLWHPLWGWAVALGDSRNQYDEHFSAYILVTSEPIRFKFFGKTGWVDVEHAVAGPGVGELIVTAAQRVGGVARAAWGGAVTSFSRGCPRESSSHAIPPV